MDFLQYSPNVITAKQDSIIASEINEDISLIDASIAKIDKGSTSTATVPSKQDLTIASEINKDISLIDASITKIDKGSTATGIGLPDKFKETAGTTGTDKLFDKNRMVNAIAKGTPNKSKVKSSPIVEKSIEINRLATETLATLHKMHTEQVRHNSVSEEFYKLMGQMVGLVAANSGGMGNNAVQQQGLNPSLGKFGMIAKQ